MSLYKTALLAALALAAGPISESQAQMSDSSSAAAGGGSDPVKNRLFLMSTGSVIDEHKFSFTDSELFFLQLGYAPISRFQLSFSYFVPLFETSEAFWSAGGKVQAIAPSGYFQGLAAGCDFGLFSRIFDISSSITSEILRSVNLAASFGREAAKIHVNAAQLLYSISSGSVPFPTYMQAGTEIQIFKSGEKAGTKIIVETIFDRAENHLSLSTVFAGLRFWGKSSCGEFAWPFSRSFGNNNVFKPVECPYISFCFLI